MLRASRIIWWVKPHSLSYHAITLTSVPSTDLGQLEVDNRGVRITDGVRRHERIVGTPVDVGARFAAPARSRRNLRLGPSTSCWPRYRHGRWSSTRARLRGTGGRPRSPA